MQTIEKQVRDAADETKNDIAIGNPAPGMCELTDDETDAVSGGVTVNVTDVTVNMTD
jgi:hypothetical protein